VGENAASIEKLTALLKDRGYSVNLLNMAVPPDIAKRRMYGRFVATGHIIPTKYLDDVGVRPSATYAEMKEKGVADGYAEIDNSGLVGAARITDRAGQDAPGGSGFDDVQGGSTGAGTVASTGDARSQDHSGAPQSAEAVLDQKPDTELSSIQAEIVAAAALP
jgi:hypothetical protein